MRAVVIGGSGQIGSHLLSVLAERGHEATGTYATVAFPDLVKLDGSDPQESAAWLHRQGPDVVIYTAGFTWVDGCQRDPARAHAANVQQPLDLARVGADAGARFIYFSTDYVFDGRNGPYAESDPTNPLSVYGQAKLEAERVLAETLGENLLVVRTSWVFGPERQGKNFAYQLAGALRAGQTLVCPSDQESSPSYGPDVARAVVRLAETGLSGLIHVAGPEIMARLEFARALATGLGLDPGLVVGRPTQELRQEVPRPLKGGLLTPRSSLWSPCVLRPLSEALADFRARVTGSEGWADF